MLERIPRFPKALDHYAGDLMGIKADSLDRKMLDANGKYWGLYGTDYPVIGEVYTKGDAVTKAQVKALVPDVETLIAAYAVRQKIAGQPGRDQPVGAYISITARYMPAQALADKGDLQGAIDTITGVMKAEPQYHLQKLPVMAKIYELRGDAPAAIQGQLQAQRENEATSSQELGLHFLATLADKATQTAIQKGNAKAEKNFAKLAYKTWYRSRSRNALDFYALRQTHLYEDKYNFTAPADIIKEIKDSRQKGVPDASPTELLALGADHVIVTEEEDLVARVKDITGGKGARISFDPVGGKGLEALAGAAAENGIIFEYGALASEPTPYPLFAALSKHLTIKGYTLFEVIANPAAFQSAKKYVFDHLAAGNFKPRIDKTFPLSAIVEAHRYMESNAQIGKIVVTV